MPTVAKLAVQAATYAIDKAYDYLLPDELPGQVGCRVLVPFGRGNRLSEGMILSLSQSAPDKPLKAVRSLLDDEPVVTEKELRLALWMSRRYFCTFYDALHTILPAAVWYRYREIWSLRQPPLPDAPEREQAVAQLLQDGPLTEDKLCQALGDDLPPLLRRMEKAGLLTHTMEQQQKVRDRVVTFVSLSVPAEQALTLAGRSAKRKDVVSFLAQNGETALHDLRYFTGAAKRTVDDLCRLGAVSLCEQEEYRISEKQYAVKATDITLNDEQQRVCDALLAQIDRGEAGVTLLQGQGYYIRSDKYILLSAVKRKQLAQLKELVMEIDPVAFIILQDAHQVLGDGFKRYDRNEL